MRENEGRYQRKKKSPKLTKRKEGKRFVFMYYK